MSETEWEKHVKATNPIWEHFFKSKTKEQSKSNRYRAKCVYCSLEINGKPDLMRKHLITSCTKIGFEVKSAITRSSIKSNAEDVSSIRTSTSAGSTGSTGSSSKVMDKSITSFYSPARLSEKEQNNLNVALLHALISGGIALNFVEDFWLTEWVRMLKPSYCLPSRTTLTSNHMVQLYAEAIEERDTILQDVDCCTCLWDGWTDASHNSIYAMMLLHGFENSELMGIVNLSKERHTAKNMTIIVSEIWERSAVN